MFSGCGQSDVCLDLAGSRLNCLHPPDCVEIHVMAELPPHNVGNDAYLLGINFLYNADI